MGKKLLIATILVFAMVLYAVEIDPFDPVESKAADIYELAMPFFELSNELFEDSGEEVEFGAIMVLAEEKEIEIEPLKEEIQADPNMTDFLINEMDRYITDIQQKYLESDVIDPTDGVNEIVDEMRRELVILKVLRDNWAPRPTTREIEK